MGKSLPSISFQTVPPALPTELPRMDVAGIIGFASAGPLDTPVLVEDEVRFREIFGPDLALAWDEAAGRPAYAHLGAAVRGFFRSGGRRCWVVRVAEGASANRFPVPGLVWLGPDGFLQPACLQARSEGAWSDGLKVRTLLRRQPLGPVGYGVQGGSGFLSGLRPRLTPGDLLRVVCANRELLLLFVVDRVEDPEDEPGYRLYGREIWLRLPTTAPGALLPEGVQIIKPQQARPATGGVLSADRLTFDLLVESDGGQMSRISDLGFAAAHPFFVGALPTDADLFRSQEERGRRRESAPAHPELRQAAATPRFPLAAGLGQSELYLPIGMDLMHNPDRFGAAVSDGRAAEARNGLAAFGPELFLDPALGDNSAATLAAAVADRHDLRGFPLRRMHALWPLDEVTLVAVPDAIHPGWSVTRPPRLDRLSAPDLAEPAVDLNQRKQTLRWSGAQAAARYLVQRAEDPDFTLNLSEFQVTGSQLAVPFEPPWSGVAYYRVRAERSGEEGPWSSTVIALPWHIHSQEKEPPYLRAPEIALSAAEGRVEGWYQLRCIAPGQTDEVVFEESADAAFHGAREIHPAQDGVATFFRENVQPAYYRARYKTGGQVSPWSRSLLFDPRQAEPYYRIDPPGEQHGSLSRVHQALLRMAQARGDLFAVLSLPLQYREEQAVAYLRALHERAGKGEEGTLSYGALYHPWIAVREAGANRTVPPDGAATGMIAGKAIERGAWIAPANRPLQGVIAVSHEFSGSSRDRLLTAQINLLLKEPEGFVTRSAATLSLDPQLASIGVRRLMILLRRLALREGARLVFSPNTEQFSRRVQRQFESLLAGLYERGAFAGRTPEQAFQVAAGVTGTSDERLVVDLKVAPSRPLRYLTVRLVQTPGADGAVSEV